MAKRKRLTGVAVSTFAKAESATTDLPRSSRGVVPSLPVGVAKPKPPHRQSARRNSVVINPSANPDVLDGASALRPSPDGGGEHTDLESALKPQISNSSSKGDTLADAYATTEVIAALSAGAIEPGHDGCVPGTTDGGREDRNATKTVAPADPPVHQPGRDKKKRGPPQHVKVDSAESNNSAVDAAMEDVTRATRDAGAVEEDVGVIVDPEVNEGPDGENDESEVKEALSRPPPVNSAYLPLPWKGRLGYACLNTYLRSANPPVFSSRTCRIASILEHRHPLKVPSQPEHPTKNRPDKDQPPDVGRGQKFVEELGLANARDIVKMVRWNDKYGIKFMRLSSEMFPFASHGEYGYKLEPFAAETLAEAGKVIAELGHRVTTHPGQFTQLGSPRKQVIDASVRDLEYHNEMLSLLRLPPQQDRDAVMIPHLGGAFGDKPAALNRFRENYAKLSPSIKNRLVLENDDVVWSVHDLLPLCQELNIPFVLDFHHHNIVFDSDKIREGTKDIMELFPAIIETWTKKGITPKMHYSEPCPDAVTARSRRKHSPRVMSLPPCPDTMDLMIEAKDKEQAVFELMRTFKLPGYNLFNDIIPHARQDENKPVKARPKKATTKAKIKKSDDLDDPDLEIKEAAETEDIIHPLIPDEEVGMGGPEQRVYWPPGMEDWLRPPKRIVKKKDETAGAMTPAKKKRKTTATRTAGDDASLNGEVSGGLQYVKKASTLIPAKKAAQKLAAAGRKAASSTRKRPPRAVPTSTPSLSDDEGDDSPLSDLADDAVEEIPISRRRQKAMAYAPKRRRSGRVSGVSYKEEEVDEMSL